MRIFSGVRSISKLCLAHERFALLKFRYYETVHTKRNCCPNLLRQSPAHVRARPAVLSFRCSSDLVDTSKKHVCKDDPMSDSSGSTTRDPKLSFTLDVLVALLKEENAVDICVIKVPRQIKYTEYFIVVSGLSTRHLKAMALYAIRMYKYLKKDNDSPAKIEGKDAGDWMCIDFGKMVVHFLLPETREVLELEKLWTLRNYDEQLKRMPVETLPEDFIYELEVTKP